MRIGYGYGRTSEDFGRAKVDKLYIDTAFTEREERNDLLLRGLRPGDTLVLLAIGDLGAGKGLAAIRRRLREVGVIVEVFEQRSGDKRPPGRPAQFSPTPEQDEKIRELWYMDGVYAMRHVLQRAQDIYGQRVSRNQLDTRYGPRDGSMPQGRKRK